MLRAIIVDDEELSVKRLKRILSESGEIGICHTFLNPSNAYEFVKSNPIDVAFLDISMPEVNGIKLSKLLLDLDDSIAIVFVTGYERYAVQAFDMSALDYIMKPITAKRVSVTLNKLRKWSRPAAIETTMSVLMFNGLRIYRGDPNGEPVTLRSPKTEELFAFLVCKGTATREEIIDTLWGDLEKDKALNNLNTTLYYIRRAIGASKTGSCVIASRSEIRIEENGLYCDLYEFERLLKQIRRGPESSADLFKQAEVLYTGAFLKGKTYDWADEKKRSLEQNYIELLEAVARFHMQMNRMESSLHYFCEILKLDAMREDISHEAIRLYVELGRKNEAVQQYRMLEKMLQQELGMKPDPRIKEFISNVSAENL